MTDRPAWVRWFAPAGLVALLAAGWLLPSPEWLRLGTTDLRSAERMQTVIGGLPDAPRLLVGFDPDLGTYAEVRPTVRALLGELLERDAQLDVVSVTPEGRALAIAERARLQRDGVDAERLGDLGYVAGAEAALVDLASGLADAYDAILVIGGNDIGPRSWVEQVVPRAGDVPLLAVTPSVLLPEVQPFLASGQLDAALITPREGAAFRAGVAAPGAGNDVSTLGLLVGMLAAIAVLAQAVGARSLSDLRAIRAREAE